MSKNIEQALQEAASFFRAGSIEAPRSEAEYLLCFLLQVERSYLYAHGGELLSEEQLGRFQELVGRRAQREPMAYLTGQKEFMGAMFQVGPDVLIPRPETEHLVEGVLKWVDEILLQSPKGRKENLKVLDLGTGCGNIGIMLALNLPGAEVTGVDISPEAIRVAQGNALKHGVAERVTFLCGSFWEPFTPGQDFFQVVVSNPPYISGEEIPFLAQEVQKEPILSLDGGWDGLKFYREILASVRNYLVSPGLLALEIDENQSGEVSALGEAQGLRVKEIIQDYAQRERVIIFEG